MTLIAVVGDCATTTTLALAAARAREQDLVVEADPTGGSIAAWLDVPLNPSLSAVVANLRGTTADGASTWERVDALARRSPAGLRFLPAPTRSVEAAQAIGEAERSVLPTVARHASALVDLGRRTAAEGVPAAVRLADTVVVVHRQATASSAAAGVRVERTAELLELLLTAGARTVVAVIGDDPFEPAELADYFSAVDGGEAVATVQLADDDLAAATIAGRRGVSERRFSRLPLIRSCRGLADLIGVPAEEAG